ncbi:unnamed protein product [Toxocara canis]|uniref:Prophage PssSM-03 n=1 Tax=Toxocara canis TaxID=6265 RepID=A0A183U1D9_TOXCA|nr:unnamed protein product [Toxocara canis]
MLLLLETIEQIGRHWTDWTQFKAEWAPLDKLDTLKESGHHWTDWILLDRMGTSGQIAHHWTGCTPLDGLDTIMGTMGTEWALA